MTVPRNRRGFALLAVLVLVLIVATLMAAVARRSAQRAMQARRAEAALQRRWIGNSAAQAFLPRVEKRLEEAAEQSTDPVPPASVSLQWEVAERTIRVRLSDEQAKANVNRLAELLEGRKLRDAIRRLARTRGRSLRVELDPTDNQANAGGGGRDPFGARGAGNLPFPAYGSFDQLFKDPSRAILFEERGGRDRPGGPASRITCWGDGRLHWRRAPEEALLKITRPVIGRHKASDLALMRRAAPDATLPELLRTLEIPTAEARLMEKHLSSAARCHSVLVTLESPNRTWHRLAVAWETEGRGRETRLFKW
jgi:Tfp pilus assembly protein PilX